MPSSAVLRRLHLLTSASVLVWILGGLTAPNAAASPARGFDTVVIDAGHGGLDRGGGPGQLIPEKPYTLDTALRLQRALQQRGFRTVMTRTSDVFVSLPERVAIANSFRNAIFISVHYNSAPRVDAHGYETYYYRSDSFGLATRLHRAQLATLDTEDRNVRRRGFYVVRKPAIPAVLCEGGFLTNPTESRTVLSAAYRQRWADNIADALVAQRRQGDPTILGYQPPITSERSVSHHRTRGSSRGHHRSGGSRGHSHGHSGSSHGRSRSTHTTRHTNHSVNSHHRHHSR